MNRMKTYAAVFLAAMMIFCLPFAGADPSQIYSGPNHQPEVSPNSASPGGPDPGPDATTQFFGNNPLGSNPVDGGGVLSPDEIKVVIELIDRLPSLQDQAVEQQPIQMITDRTRQTLAAKKTLNLFAFLLHEYGAVKQKLHETSSFERILNPEYEEKPLLAEHIDTSLENITPENLKEKIMVEMDLQVTEAVVDANEKFNVSEDHPFMDWLIMREMPEGQQRALREAEAQRTAMAEAFKEAKKNGKRVLFMVNGKITRFFFKIPLFLKGDYKLLILDENEIKPQIFAH